MNIITIDNVCKNYKSKKALDNVSLSIKQGELFGLLGVNGAGKTTLIKILCGLTKKTSGTITINNFDLDKEIDKIKEIIDKIFSDTQRYFERYSKASFIDVVIFSKFALVISVIIFSKKNGSKIAIHDDNMPKRKNVI